MRPAHTICTPIFCSASHPQDWDASEEIWVGFQGLQDPSAPPQPMVQQEWVGAEGAEKWGTPRPWGPQKAPGDWEESETPRSSNSIWLVTPSQPN